MKLRNKRTGEIVSLEGELLFDNEVMLLKQYASLAELNAEWEDYNELEYWYIDDNGDILLIDLDDNELWKDLAEQRKQIGNYFNKREEAEKAVEKLKAWKRLKDKGFRFKDWNCAMQEITFDVPESFYDREGMVGKAISDETTNDLDLLFCTEENS